MGSIGRRQRKAKSKRHKKRTFEDKAQGPKKSDVGTMSKQMLEMKPVVVLKGIKDNVYSRLTATRDCLLLGNLTGNMGFKSDDLILWKLLHHYLEKSIEMFENIDEVTEATRAEKRTNYSVEIKLPDVASQFHCSKNKPPRTNRKSWKRKRTSLVLPPKPNTRQECSRPMRKCRSAQNQPKPPRTAEVPRQTCEKVQCDICCAFLLSKNLARHVKTIHKNRKVTCDLCGSKYAAKYLKSHKRLRHNV